MHDLDEIRRVGAGACSRFADPARGSAAGGDQLAIAGRSDLDDLADRTQRAPLEQRCRDHFVDLARHGIAAVGEHRTGNRLQFAGQALAQIAVDEALDLGRSAGTAAFEHRPGRSAGNAVEPGLHFVDIAAQRGDRLVGAVLAGGNVEAFFENVGAKISGLGIHGHFTFHKNDRPDPARCGCRWGRDKLVVELQAMPGSGGG